MLSLYKFLKFLFRHVVPRDARYPLVHSIAHGVIRFNRDRREVIVGNLTPLVGAERAQVLAPVVLGNFLETAVDFFCASKSLPSYLEIENWDVLPRAYEKNKRVMMVTAHIGHWELGMSTLVEKGFPVAGVYAPYRDDAIVSWIMSHRNTKVEWISATPGAADRCVAAIEKGRILGMVADIPFSELGRKVKIHGHTARLPIGPWLIAARAQATVIPAFVLRIGEARYRATLHAPIVPGQGKVRQVLSDMQDVYRKHLESYLERVPEQWGVLQPFWVPPKN